MDKVVENFEIDDNANIKISALNDINIDKLLKKIEAVVYANLTNIILLFPFKNSDCY